MGPDESGDYSGRSSMLSSFVSNPAPYDDRNIPSSLA